MNASRACRLLGLLTLTPGGVLIWLIPASLPLFTSDPSDWWLSLTAVIVIGLIAWRVLRIGVSVEGTRMTIRNPWRTVKVDVTSATEFHAEFDGFTWARGVASTGVTLRNAGRDTRIMATFYADEQTVDAWAQLMSGLRARTGCATALPQAWSWRAHSM